ncbi:MAG: 2-amino-4-hydroxy-6-hydroxymethyldihydropteridine diphosphokinase [Chloroflexi bacterium]|nr:2-amino-4-hydroxy-6-hydroxymethyldihydropteridine diphosphokinase [Chloroflexota bacterium]
MAANTVFITLGSNIAPETNLPLAVQHLAGRVALRAVSRVYQTAPIDAQGQIARDQGYFLNAAILAETDLSPADLKRVLRAIEAELGRQRSADKFAPRPIDLDLALFDDLVLDDPASGLTLPDPDILKWAHIALPLADLAPEHPHPMTGETLRAIAARFEGTPGVTVRDDVRLNAG